MEDFHLQAVDHARHTEKTPHEAGPVELIRCRHQKGSWCRSVSYRGLPAAYGLFSAEVLPRLEDIELDILTFGQAGQARQARFLDRRDVDENVFAAILGLHESVALRRIELLNRAARS
jgi:hypothetical protein